MDLLLYKQHFFTFLSLSFSRTHTSFRRLRAYLLLFHLTVRYWTTIFECFALCKYCSLVLSFPGHSALSCLSSIQFSFHLFFTGEDLLLSMLVFISHCVRYKNKLPYCSETHALIVRAKTSQQKNKTTKNSARKRSGEAVGWIYSQS